MYSYGMLQKNVFIGLISFLTGHLLGLNKIIVGGLISHENEGDDPHPKMLFS